MIFNSKLGVITIKVSGIIALGSVILATIGFLIFKKSGNQENVKQNTNQESEKKLDAGGNKSLAPTNAFLPPLPLSLYREEPRIFIPPPQETSPLIQEPSLTTSSFTDLSKIKDLISPPTLVPPRQDEILTLPEVLENDLLIDQGGVKNLQTYLEYFNAHSGEINFSYGEKFASVLKDESGIPLFPVELIEKALKENNFASIHNSLSIFKEFFSAKINFLKSIKVWGDALEINKIMIGLDKLAIDLMDKALDFESGKITKTDFEDFFKKYKATGLFYNFQFTEKLNASSSIQSRGFINDLLAIFGLTKIARALGFPFGGLIAFSIPCFCSFGVSMIVGPPIGGNFYISFATMASPAFFPFKQVHPGAYILGNYVLGSPGCWQPAPPSPVCVPINFPFATITIAGTSI